MAEEIERVYTIPLRNAALAPRPKRANRAVTEVRQFLARHMKTGEEQVWIDGPVNELLWDRGIQKPPRRIRVRAIKFEDGIVEVSLPESETHAKRAAIQEEREKVAEERAAAFGGAGAEEEEEKPAAAEEEKPAAAATEEEAETEEKKSA